MNKKRALYSIVVTIVLVGILLTQTDFRSILKVLSSVNLYWVILGLVLYVFSYLFRALRFKIILSGKISISDLFPIVCVHGMMNNVLPLRTGELSYIYLIKRKNFSMGEGIATLMVARIFDFIAISFLFLISVVSIKRIPEAISEILLIVGTLLTFVTLLLIFLISLKGSFIKIIELAVDKLRLNNLRITRFLLSEGRDIIKNFRLIRSKNILIHPFFISVLLWICLYSADYALIHAIGLELDILRVILAATFCYFATILPIQGIAGFGTMEGSLSFGFIIVGISKDIAISSSFAIHILSFSFFMLLGSLGILAMKLKEH